MMSDQTPHDELQQLQRLERENRLLRQGIKQADRMQRLWQESLEQLREARQRLKQQNQHLSSLYRAASILSQTTDQRQLLNNILDVMEELLALPKSLQMAIFLIEEQSGRLRLVAQRNASDEFIRAHEQLKVGECLCGRAALGEVIITHNCGAEQGRTIPYDHGEPHGHLILPLKSKEKVIGVFCYYLPPEYEVGRALLDTFTTIGSQLGMAIENARLYGEILELTTKDALTGLGNRRYLKEVLERDLYNVDRYKGVLSLLMIDLDHFKRFNDTHGHLAGDHLLAQVAKILREQVRTGDLPVRYGGEEFMVLLPQTDLDSAAIVAERVRRVIEEMTEATASIGVASVSDKRCNPDNLIDAADKALYRAKKSGRNRIEVERHTL